MDGRLHDLLRVLEAGPFDSTALGRARELVDVLQSAGLAAELESARGSLVGLLDTFAEKSGSPVVASAAHLLAADLCEMGGGLDACVERLELAMDMDPENRAAPLLLRRVLGAHKDRPRLLTLLIARVTALQHWPGAEPELVATALAEVGGLHAEAHQWDEAIEAFERARRQHEHGGYIKALIDLYVRRGQMGDRQHAADLLCLLSSDLSEEEALPYLERAVSLVPDHLEARRRLPARRSLAPGLRQRTVHASLSPAAQRRLDAAEAERSGAAPAVRVSLRRHVVAPPPPRPSSSVAALSLAPTEPQLAMQSPSNQDSRNYLAPLQSVQATASSVPAPVATQPRTFSASMPASAPVSRELSHEPSTQAQLSTSSRPTPASVTSLQPVSSRVVLAPRVRRVRWLAPVLGALLVASLGIITATRPWASPKGSLRPESSASSQSVVGAALAGGPPAAVSLARAATLAKKEATTILPSPEPSAAAPKIALATLSAEQVRERGAAIDQGAMVAALQGAMPTVQSCYEAVLRDQPRLQGSLLLRVVVTRHGVADSVGRLGGDVENAELEACIVRAFVGVSYPMHSGRANARLRVPLHFSSASTAK